MRLNQIDLNLFLVFDAIYTERNLTRAAGVLCITQPAVSNALGRLRKSLNDQLFVRTPQGMIPTPVAENMIGQVREALQLLNLSVQEGDVFEPVASDKTFQFSMNDFAESLVLPPLLEQLQQQAPEIGVNSYYIGREDIPKALASGQLDFAIDVPLLNDANLCHMSIREAAYVCLLRKNHPDIGDSLSMEQYLGLKHIMISSRRTGASFIDVALNRLGHQRDICLRARHYKVAPEIAERTDLALTVPVSGSATTKLKALALPFDVEPVNWHLYWHKSADNDQANRWMRDLLENVIPE